MSKTGMPDGVRAALGWAVGIGVIALALVILLIIFGNLSGNVGFTQTSSAFTNQTIAFTDAGSTPAGASNRVNGALSNVVVTNATGGETVPSSNYTTSGVVITAVGSSLYNGSNVNVSYTVTYDSDGLVNTNNVITNYSLSATNISAQFPTVGTIVGIALLLVVLIGILVFAIVKLMGVSTSSRGGGSSGDFDRGGFG